jgi:glycine betaine/proline transport system ATP-binding protein
MGTIAVQNLYKIFGPSPERAIPLLEKGKSKEDILRDTKLSVGVNNVSFTAEDGEILVIMGLSGSGKSTLVRCINRLIEPTAGEVNINDTNVSKLEPEQLRQFRQKHMGMVFQNFALFPHRSVIQNVEYGLELQGVDQDIRRKAAGESLEKVGLAGWEDSLPRQLSGGMQQRVGLARALAMDPDILLMDEAFSALDPLIRRDMQDELLNLQDEMQKTILFISHDLDEALKLGNRIILMKDGAVVQTGTPEDILTDPADDYVTKFVEDVDITKVLTAESVMKKTEAVAYLKSDGPRGVLRKMRKNAISSLFVLDDAHRVAGIVTVEDCAKFLEEGGRDIKEILRTDVRTVEADTPATELIEILFDLPYPLAVTNSAGKIQGVIVRGTLLGAIAGKGIN